MASSQPLTLKGLSQLCFYLSKLYHTGKVVIPRFWSRKLRLRREEAEGIRRLGAGPGPAEARDPGNGTLEIVLASPDPARPG